MKTEIQKQSHVDSSVMSKMDLFILSIVIGLMAVSCSKMREKSAEEIMENPKMQDEIFSQIIKDHSLMSKFISKMEGDESCSLMMMNSAPMMRMMCVSSKMDSLMDSDSELHKAMMSMMMLRMEKDSSACAKMCEKVSEGNCKKMNKKN